MILTIRRELVHSLYISKWIPFLCTTLERDLHNGRFISSEIVFNNENIHAIFSLVTIWFSISAKIYLLSSFNYLDFWDSFLQKWNSDESLDYLSTIPCSLCHEFKNLYRLSLLTWADLILSKIVFSLLLRCASSLTGILSLPALRYALVRPTKQPAIRTASIMARTLILFIACYLRVLPRTEGWS